MTVIPRQCIGTHSVWAARTSPSSIKSDLTMCMYKLEHFHLQFEFSYISTLPTFL